MPEVGGIKFVKGRSFSKKGERFPVVVKMVAN